MKELQETMSEKRLSRKQTVVVINIAHWQKALFFRHTIDHFHPLTPN